MLVSSSLKWVLYPGSHLTPVSSFPGSLCHPGPTPWSAVMQVQEKTLLCEVSATSFLSRWNLEFHLQQMDEGAHS